MAAVDIVEMSHLHMSSVCPQQGQRGRGVSIQTHHALLSGVDSGSVCVIVPWSPLLGWTCHCTRSLSFPGTSPLHGCPAAGKLRTRTSRWVSGFINTTVHALRSCDQAAISMCRNVMSSTGEAVQRFYNGLEPHVEPLRSLSFSGSLHCYHHKKVLWNVSSVFCNLFIFIIFSNKCLISFIALSLSLV